MTIDLGEFLPDEDSTNRGVGTPPPGIVSFTVTITAPDMQTIQKTISLGTRYINISVPSGKDRYFRLDANLDPVYMSSVNRSHLLSYAGEATADILPGKYIALHFSMGAGTMKIIIPEYCNGGATPKLALIPDLTPISTEWIEITRVFDTRAGANVALQPWELDFDGSGRIFFQNRYSGTLLLRINEINASSTLGIAFNPSLLNTFAVDRIGDAIYYDAYAGTQQLFRCSLDFTGSTIVSPQPAGISTFSSMEFNSGILFILVVGPAGAGSAPVLLRYNLLTGITPHTYAQASPTDPYFADPRDIIIKGNYIYVANRNSAKISRFDKNTLTPLDAFGTKTNTNDDRQPGHFYAPHHFIAKTNRKIYLIDDADWTFSATGKNRIVAFDEVGTWSGWETFRAEDIGQSAFRFYEC